MAPLLEKQSTHTNAFVRYLIKMFDYLRKIVLNWLFTSTFEVIIGEGGKNPKKAYSGDAGLDLYTSKKTIVEPGQAANVSTSVDKKDKNSVPWVAW